jgi:hypothetical protein
MVQSPPDLRRQRQRRRVRRRGGTSSNVSRVDREELSSAVDGPTAQMGC